MEDKKTFYEIISDCWDMAKRYCFIPLDGFLWEMWINETKEKSDKYKGTSDELWQLYREIIQAIIHYKESKDRRA